VVPTRSVFPQSCTCAVTRQATNQFSIPKSEEDMTNAFIATTFLIDTAAVVAVGTAAAFSHPIPLQHQQREQYRHLQYRLNPHHHYSMSMAMTILDHRCSSNDGSSFCRDDWVISSLDTDNENVTEELLTAETTGETEDYDSNRKKKQIIYRRKTHLFLHFDINETILLGDDAGGDTRDESIQKMIAKSAFVRMPLLESSTVKDSDSGDETAWERTQEMEPTHWWDGQPIVESAADTNIVEGGEEEGSNDSTSTRRQLPQPQPPKLYTGWDWPPGCCPYYRTKYKKYSKDFVFGGQQQQQQKRSPGHGHIYKPVLTACEDALLSSRNADGDDEDKKPDHILPAFYRTLQYLAEEDEVNNDYDEQEVERKITIVFRTFGSDLDEISRVVTEFAQGRHPDYPNVNCPQLSFPPGNLYQGRWRDMDGTISGSIDETTKAVYQLWTRDEKQLVASGDAEILEFLKQQKHCIGIRDDYQYWKKYNYDPTAGKPVWVPRYDDDCHPFDDNRSHASCYYDHHLLFDDNIHNLPHDGIACVRQQQGDGSYVSVAGSIMHKAEQGFQGIHMIRVPTIEPVLNPNWYIQQINMARNRFQHKLLQSDSQSS
jgi:hypothetical protein